MNEFQIGDLIKCSLVMNLWYGKLGIIIEINGVHDFKMIHVLFFDSPFLSNKPIVCHFKNVQKVS